MAETGYTYKKEHSLSEVLQGLGMTHKKSETGIYRHDVYKDDVFLLKGTAGDVWYYLRENKLI